MKRILDNEYIYYKNGFLDGKTDLMSDYVAGKIYNPNFEEEEKDISEEDKWYSLGYEDGFNYAKERLDANHTVSQILNSRDAINEALETGYQKRVLEYNQETKETMSSFKFRM